jgi:Acetyltransferase (GNAT) domain
MIVIETDRIPFHLIEVYYPETYPLNGYKPRLNNVVYLRQARLPLDAGRFVVRARASETTLIDLSLDVDLLLREMSATTRRQIRKIDRLGGRLAVRRNDRTALKDYRAIYNNFVTQKKHAERLSERRLNALSRFTDIFVAYFEGRPLCGHAFIRDHSLKRVGLLMSASTRFENQDAPIFIGSVNRWLHWHEIQLYKSEGMRAFDFGGIGRDTIEKEGVARFKLSFGGRPVIEYNYILAGKLGQAAISLFYAIRRLRSLNLRRIKSERLRPCAWG